MCTKFLKDLSEQRHHFSDKNVHVKYAKKKVYLVVLCDMAPVVVQTCHVYATHKYTPYSLIN